MYGINFNWQGNANGCYTGVTKRKVKDRIKEHGENFMYDKAPLPLVVLKIN